MQIDTQTYLDLAERANQIVFWDIETTGLKGDYNSILVSTLKPFNEKPITISVTQVGNDQRVARETKEILSQFQTVVTYYGKGFDMPFLNTRLAKWKQEPVDSMYHLDLYFSLKPKLLLARRGLGSLLEFYGTPEQKMFVGSEVWSEMGFNLKKHMPTMLKRCESDVIGTQDLYQKARHLIRDLKKG